MDAILRTENLWVEYRPRGLKLEARPALKGLNLSVQAGEVFGFLGPNGAGKTTTINVLLGFIPPTRGTAQLFDIDVRQPIARQRIGYLPDLLLQVSHGGGIAAPLRADFRTAAPGSRPAH